jgi:hypothetical protein
MLSALLMTRTLLIIGHSLTDLDFRLLFERQLSTLRGHVPARYSLMAGVSRVEAEVLFRSSGIKILPYDAAGQNHREALGFLRQLHGATLGPTRRGSGSTTTSPRGPGLAQRPSSLPPGAAVLSIRADGQLLLTQFRSHHQTSRAVGRARTVDWSKVSGSLTVHPTTFRFKSDLRNVGGLLARLLPQDLVRALAEVPSTRVVTLVLSPEVATIPWELLTVAGKPLCRRNPLIRAPIAISDQARGYPQIHAPIRLLLIGDPGGDLPHALQEATRIIALYQRQAADCKALLGKQATYDAVVEHLLSGAYDVVHFSGRAAYDDQEAHLVLHGFALLRASELRTLINRRPPAVLILNSPFTAFTPAPISDGGPGRLTFAQVASTAGVGAFVGCFGVITDDGAEAVAVALHEEILAGRPMAMALQRARTRASGRLAKTGGRDPSDVFYTMSGYPGLTLTNRPRSVK